LLDQQGAELARWRLSKLLQRQDWVAVAIDLLILVVGVFLGIQASNWNDDRKDRHLARGYLDRIRSDLVYDLKGLRAREAYWRASAEAGDRALAFAEARRVDRDQWTTLLDFFNAGQIWNWTPSDGTYREMLSSGRLDLLSNAGLKTPLSAYYVGRQTQARALFDTLPAYREEIRAALPYRFQRYILDKCDANVSNGFQGRPACPPPSDVSGLAELNRSLAGDPKLIGDLRSWMTTLHYARGVGIENQGSAARLIARIDSEKN
jgi:hypothetical protein